MKIHRCFTFIFLTVVLSPYILSTNGQVATGGQYTLEQSVIANGGGRSTGSIHALDGTSGQSAAGDALTGGRFIAKSGFWIPAALGPTASGVSVSGHVLTADGRGLRNAVVTITDSLGLTRSMTTGAFGNYQFDGVQSGETVVVTVASKRFHFTSRVLSVTDTLSDVDFIGEE